MTTETQHGGSDLDTGTTHAHAVVITINDNEYRIAPGRHTVAEIKRIGHVPATDDLEQLINGQLTLLPDDGHVVIHGTEVFVSHVKTGASS